MELTAGDVREVRFGTTRMRAGYNMAEVDAFLDTVEKAIAAYSTESVRLKDEADALRSQVQQVHGRLEALQAELAEARAATPASSPAPATPAVDEDSTAENPVVVVTEGASTSAATDIIETGDADTRDPLARLLRVREDVRVMLERQLELVDGVEIPRDDAAD